MASAETRWQVMATVSPLTTGHQWPLTVTSSRNSCDVTFAFTILVYVPLVIVESWAGHLRPNPPSQDLDSIHKTADMSEAQASNTPQESLQEGAAGPSKSALKKKAKEEEKARKAEERKRKEDEAKAAKAAADAMVCHNTCRGLRSQIDWSIGCVNRQLWQTPASSVPGRNPQRAAEKTRDYWG